MGVFLFSFQSKTHVGETWCGEVVQTHRADARLPHTSETFAICKIRRPVAMHVGSKGIATRNKCIATRNRCLTSSNKKLLGAPGLTTRSKKLL